MRRIFTNPEAAAAELCHVLPSALVSRLDWATLRIESGSFVDLELQPRTSDILYSVAPTDATLEVSIYVVLEHQSSPDAAVAARFLVYVGQLYERHLARNPGTRTVPLVVPVLLYQGPSGWTLPRRLSDLLDVFPSPIELAFAVDDLDSSVLSGQITRDQLLRDRGLALAEMARTMLWLYHHPEAIDGKRATMLSHLASFISEVWGSRAVEPFLTGYLSAFDPDSSLRAIVLESTNEETRLMYAAIREQLIAEGMGQGPRARPRAWPLCWSTSSIPAISR